MAIPAIWCAISGATLLALKAHDFWIPPFAAAVAASLAVWQNSRSRKEGQGDIARSRPPGEELPDGIPVSDLGRDDEPFRREETASAVTIPAARIRF